MPDSIKPKKPRKGLPVFLHATGQYCWKFRNRFYYLGADPEAAIEEYLRTKDYIRAGKQPPPDGESGITLRDLCNAFMTAKETMRDAGELAQRSYNDYHATCERLLKIVGKSVQVNLLDTRDFDRLRGKLAQTMGPTTLGNEIQRIRSVFKWGWESRTLDRMPHYGPNFKKPSRRRMREHRNQLELERGPRMWEAMELLAILQQAESKPHLKAMILLGINAAYEPHDLQKLPFAALPDLDGTDDRWLTWPRPKTGIKRKAWMWPETAEALRSYLQSRPHPKEKAADHLVFITKYGQAWGNSMNHFPVSQEFRKLAQEAGVYRPSVGFLGLRHAFETIAGDTGDQVAVDMVMGHDRADMASIYRERVKDERIQKVCDAVRQWILSNSPNGKMWPDVELPCGKG